MTKNIKIEISAERHNPDYFDDVATYRLVTVTMDDQKYYGHLYPRGKGNDEYGEAIRDLQSKNIDTSIINYAAPVGILLDTNIETPVVAQTIQRKYPVDAIKAKEWDDLHNEGGEGYNPYR